MAKLILLNKPYRVLSQFTDKASETNSSQEQSVRKTLASFIATPGVYPAGRLDYDSEGLLLLTDNGVLQSQISNPKHKLSKTYWVQVEGEVDKTALEHLRKGITLKDGKTKPAKVQLIDEPKVWERHPPVRFRQSIPTHWLQMTITEGKNRQVRRMTAAVGLPTLRLIRYSIGNWCLNDLQPGEWEEQTVHIQANNASQGEPKQGKERKRMRSSKRHNRPNR